MNFRIFEPFLKKLGFRVDISISSAIFDIANKPRPCLRSCLRFSQRFHFRGPRPRFQILSDFVRSSCFLVLFFVTSVLSLFSSYKHYSNDCFNLYFTFSNEIVGETPAPRRHQHREDSGGTSIEKTSIKRRHRD